MVGHAATVFRPFGHCHTCKLPVTHLNGRSSKWYMVLPQCSSSFPPAAATADLTCGRGAGRAQQAGRHRGSVSGRHALQAERRARQGRHRQLSHCKAVPHKGEASPPVCHQLALRSTRVSSLVTSLWAITVVRPLEPRSVISPGRTCEVVQTKSV